MFTYTLKIEKIQPETEDTVTICFKQPALKKIKYLAGQYLTLIFRINGRRYIRPYSFSSAPGIDSTLNVTVKRVLGGIVSNHIIDKLTVGDIIEVLEPMGDFTLKTNTTDFKYDHIVLWGSGSGITPLMSICKYALNNPYYKHVTLVYGNRSFETAIFSEQIKTLRQEYPNKFSVWHFLTKAVINDVYPNVVQGRINPTMVLDIINTEHNIKDTVHYICGPIGLKDSVRTQLLKMSVSRQSIFSEDFEIVRDPKAFEDIYTKNVSINNKGIITTFEVPKGKSILEAGLDSFLELSYSCQTGSCLLCKANLINGKIKVIGIEKLPAEIKNTECLLCCSFPVTDDVKISINN